ncbi:unnamed protein product [Victoria cruziana]
MHSMPHHDAWLLYDTLSENSLHNTGPTVLRHQPVKKGVSKLGSGSQMDSKLDFLSRKMDQLLSSHGIGYGQPVCTLCDGVGHVTDDCPISRIDSSSGQAVNAAQVFSRPYDLYSSIYNPGWRHHLNFGWRNIGYQIQQPQLPTPPQRPAIEYPQRQIVEYLQAQRQIVPASSSIEDRLVRIYEDIRASNEKAHACFDRELGSHSENLAKYDQILVSHSQMLQRMEQQMGRMAEALGQRHVEGSLPSQPLGNSKGKGPVYMIEEPGRAEQYDVSTLRSGREYQPQPQHQEQQQYQPPPPQHYQPLPQPPLQDQPSSTTTTGIPSRGATTAPYASSPSG